MKKWLGSILALAVALTAVLCGCSGGETPQNTARAAKGYSLAEVALSLDTGLMTQRVVTEQDAGICGTATELLAGAEGKQVSALYLQAFYRKDLEQAGAVQAGSSLLSEDALASCRLYENEELVVYDLSNYLYGDTMSARMEKAGVEETSQAAGEINECISRVHLLIVPETEAPVTPVQETTYQIAF